MTEKNLLGRSIIKSEEHKLQLIISKVQKLNTINWAPIDTAAELLGISKRKLYYLKKEGKIATKYMYNKLYFDVSFLFNK